MQKTIYSVLIKSLDNKKQRDPQNSFYGLIKKCASLFQLYAKIILISGVSLSLLLWDFFLFPSSNLHVCLIFSFSGYNFSRAANCYGESRETWDSMQMEKIFDPQPTHVDMKKNLQNSVINVHRKYTNKFAFKSLKENPVEPWKIQIRINQIFPTRWRFSGLGIVWRDKFIAPDNFLSLSLTDWPAPDTAILSPTTKRWEAQATPWSTTFATYTPFEVLKYHHSILPQIIKPVSSESRLKAEMSISGETISLVFSRLLIICLTPNHFFFRGCQPLKRQVFDVWLTDKNSRSVHVKNDLTLKESRAHKQLGPKNTKNWELSFKTDKKFKWMKSPAF